MNRDPPTPSAVGSRPMRSARPSTTPGRSSPTRKHAEPKILTAAEASAMVANVEKCMCSNSPAQVADEYEESQAMSWAE